MNLTTFELSQALMESIGALACLISAGVLIYRGINRTTRKIRNMFFVVAIMLVCDGAAYIFRGNTDIVSVVMTRISNYGEFLMNILLLFTSGRLIQATAPDKISEKHSRIYMRILAIISAIALLILIVNMFTGIMFYFDGDNYYHRALFWYIYTVIILLGGIVSILYTISNRREMGLPLAVTLIIYELLPLILSIFQAIFYGISISVTGVAIGIIVIMYGYFFSVEAVRFTSDEESRHWTNYPLWIYTAIILLIVSMSAAFIIAINSFGRVLSQNGIEGNGYYILQNIWPSIVIFYVGIIILLGLFIIMFSKEWRARRQSEENRQASISDELTGLLNRRAYEKRIEMDLREEEDHSSLVVVMCDINGLKSTNDMLGHEAGDDLIKGAANCIRSALGEYGNIYRIGGDEFTAIVNCTEEEQQAAIANLEKECRSWQHPVVRELSVSIGCVRASEYPDTSIGGLARMADELMYADKDAYYQRTGRDRRKI